MEASGGVGSEVEGSGEGGVRWRLLVVGSEVEASGGVGE